MARYVVFLAVLGLVAAATAQPAGNTTLPGGGQSPQHVCEANEVWYLCGKVCEASCRNPCPNHDLCPSTVCTQATASCRCQPGYVRDTALTGQCVLQINCPTILN